jgi:hypothetical protein
MSDTLPAFPPTKKQGIAFILTSILWLENAPGFKISGPPVA